MAKLGHALLWIMLLTTLADSTLGLNSLDSVVGTFQVTNMADYDITYQLKIHFVNGDTNVVPVYYPLLKANAFHFPVIQSMDTITTLFRMSTNADSLPKYQVIVDWSLNPVVMKVSCLPNCFWVVDNKGFSVADSEYGQQQFVTGWD